MYSPWSLKPKKKDFLEPAESELQEFDVRKIRGDGSLFDVDEGREVDESPHCYRHGSTEYENTRRTDDSSRIASVLRRLEILEDPRSRISMIKVTQDKTSLSNAGLSCCSSSRDFEELSDADTMSAGQITPTVQPLQSEGLKGASGKALCCWHVIEDSDTISGICIRYGISEEALLRANRASRAALLARKSILIPLIENMEC